MGCGNAVTDDYIAQLHTLFSDKVHYTRIAFPMVTAQCPSCARDMRRDVEFSICPECEQSTGRSIGFAFVSIGPIPERLKLQAASTPANPNAPKVKCRECGLSMLQRTADKNDGYCARCIIDIRNPPRVPPPLKPLTLEELKARIATQDRDRIIDAVFNRAAEKELREYTEGDIIVYTVATLHGETLNGGIRQYFDNPSGYLAHLCAPSLRRIGAGKYADIVETCIRAFTTTRDRSDPQWETDQRTFEAGKKDPFAELEKPLWDLLENEDELPNLLYQFIVANPEMFVAREFD